MSKKIAVVIPTIRPDAYEKFLEAWSFQFKLHNVEIITVWDSESPTISHEEKRFTLSQVMGSDTDLICNFTSACRNLGFAFVAKCLPDVEYIVTLDDDVRPIGDTIGDHIAQLQRRVPVSFFNTFHNCDYFPRGFPYNLRDEAEVVLSHGPWIGIKDWDAPTQLVLGNPDVEFYVGPVPKGVEMAICGMNVAFKRKVLPLVYYAPAARYPAAERFDDIFWGRHFKREIDQLGLAMVTGYGAVSHDRLSNTYKNLQKEAVGIEVNDKYWSVQNEDFFVMYADARKRWQAFIRSVDKNVI